MTNYDSILKAIKYLDSVCDGAHAHDRQGFNGRDTKFGKSLAKQSSLSAKQQASALKMLKKYHRQLESAGIYLSSEQSIVIANTQVTWYKAEFVASYDDKNISVTAGTLCRFRKIAKNRYDVKIEAANGKEVTIFLTDGEAIFLLKSIRANGKLIPA